MSDLEEAHATITNLLSGMSGWEKKYNVLRTRLAAAEEQAANLRHDLEHCRAVRSHLGVSMSDPVVMVDVDVFDRMVADLAAARRDGICKDASIVLLQEEVLKARRETKEAREMALEMMASMKKEADGACRALEEARAMLQMIRDSDAQTTYPVWPDVIDPLLAILAPERPREVHNHGIDPSCQERIVDGRLVGECMRPREERG